MIYYYILHVYVAPIGDILYFIVCSHRLQKENKKMNKKEQNKNNKKRIKIKNYKIKKMVVRFTEQNVLLIDLIRDVYTRCTLTIRIISSREAALTFTTYIYMYIHGTCMYVCVHVHVSLCGGFTLPITCFWLSSAFSMLHLDMWLQRGRSLSLSSFSRHKDRNTQNTEQ